VARDRTVLEKSDMESVPLDTSYMEVPPPPALAHLVASLWEMRIPDSPETRVRILPNACVDIVLYASETSRGEGSAALVAPPHRSFVVGSTLRSFVARSAGCRRVLGASLLPTGVQPLLGLPARVIGEAIVLLSDVIGSDAAELEERVLAGPDHLALARLADALVRLRASREAHPLVARAVTSVRQAGGQQRMDALARDHNVSTRHLERTFLEHIGIGPKLFSRLVRFDRAVRDIPRRGERSWSQFALVHGYSDQAHLINEFKLFAGATPGDVEVELASGAIPPSA
jgi:AraC-like DNA-binding protein